MALSNEAIDGWYRRYGPMVYRRCLRLLGAAEPAKEAMQDVFVKIMQRGHLLVDEAPSSLLYRVATNVCLNLIRAGLARPESAAGDLVERIAMAPDGEGGVAARHLLAKVMRQEPESTKVIAILHLLDGMTLEEVAAEVGLSVSGVRKRLAALKQHVRELDGVAWEA